MCVYIYIGVFFFFFEEKERKKEIELFLDRPNPIVFATYDRIHQRTQLLLCVAMFSAISVCQII